MTDTKLESLMTFIAFKLPFLLLTSSSSHRACGVDTSRDSARREQLRSLPSSLPWGTPGPVY